MDLREDLQIRGQVTTRKDAIDFATVLVSRRGGASERDMQFRSRLYQLVGTATVTSGHIESQMKRLLTLSAGGNQASFAEVEFMWSKLENLLRAAAKELAKDEPAVPVTWKDTSGTRILAALLWADQHHVAEARNHIVHSSWWDFADTGVTRSRFYLNGESELQYLDWDRLEDDCRNLQQFSRMLDEIVGDEWPRFYLAQETSN